jgi:arylsulfatase A
VLAWFEGRHAKVPPTLYTNKKKNDRAPDYRIMPPYQDSPEETQRVVGTKGMEVAADFTDDMCLERFTEKAIEWMKGKTESAKNGKPFFVYLPYTSPHYPVCPQEQFWGQGEAGGYGEFVIETDYRVGQILDFLEASGLDENTMIVFSSDNGPEKTWVQRIEEFDHDSSGIYQGGKRDIYEGGHRVPFFVRWPGGIDAPGRDNDSLVGQTDVLATLAEIIGAEVPDNAAEDSQSFAAVLRDAKASHQRSPLINHGISGRFAITEGTWKLIMAHGKLKTELYDLAKDPEEANNVIEQNPEIAQSLQAKITDIVINGRTTAGARQANDTGYWNSIGWISEAEYDARQPQGE